MRVAVLVVAGCGLLGLGCSQAAAGVDGGGGVTPDGSVGGAPDAGLVALDGLMGALASATCEALTRCCEPASVEGYFASYRNNTRLAAMASRFPPTTPLDPGTCPALLEEAFALVPWGGWVEAARQGSVTYVPDQATLCIEALHQATCGDAVTQALFDGTCTGFLPPSGGNSQRRMFRRTQGVGATCTALTDGVGSALYGTCNPDVAFCCARRDGGTDCGFPGVDAQGECTAVSAPGEACTAFPLQLCATGATCDSATDTCVVESTNSLELGQTCVTPNFTSLGECAVGWCDVLGSRACEPARPDGQTCQGASECSSGACESGTCRSSTFCRGR